jgi:hypothetical protein
MTTTRERDDLDELVEDIRYASSADKEYTCRVLTVRLMAELVRTTRELVEQQKIANGITSEMLSDSRMRGP